jgi:hypothetical protein
MLKAMTIHRRNTTQRPVTNGARLMRSERYITSTAKKM